MSTASSVLTEDLLLQGYRAGIFPMAASRDDPALSWYDPERRGILPLDGFHAPRRLLRTVRSGPYTVSADRAFVAVIAACAESRPGREESWINAEIARLFGSLHRRGLAHSVECWQGDTLVGGLYGLSIGRAFFGESMFSRARDASKVSLVHLVARLRLAGFTLLDTQFITDHLAQFGAIEISRRDYRRRLRAAIDVPATWCATPEPATLAAAIADLAALART
jgi:leucyl/phenylalanyl-tRNA--protein transferase